MDDWTVTVIDTDGNDAVVIGQFGGFGTENRAQQFADDLWNMISADDDFDGSLTVVSVNQFQAGTNKSLSDWYNTL